MTHSIELPDPAARDPYALLAIVQHENNSFGFALTFDCMHDVEPGADLAVRIMPCDIVAMSLAGCMMRPDSSYGAEVVRMNIAVSTLNERLIEADGDTEAGSAAMKLFSEDTGLPIDVQSPS